MKLAGAFLALIPLAFGGMEKVWEFRLSDYLSGTDPSLRSSAYDAAAVAFSPDGKFLAVTTYRDQYHAHLLIVDVASPKTAPKHFDLDVCPQDIQWSPMGAALKICDTVLRLSDGNTCHEDRSAKFVDEQHTGHFAQPNFVLDDLDCKLAASWPVDGDLVVDSAPARKLVLFRSAGQLKMLDVGTREVLQGWSHKPGPDGRGSLLDGGTAVCLLDVLKKFRLGCWELRTGAEIPAVSKLSGQFEGTAASASRVVMDTSVHVPMDITDGGCCDFSHRRKVYDPRTAREIASWPWEWDRRRGGYLWNVCVLSADGRLVAEGAKGVVRLYRLTP